MAVLVLLSLLALCWVVPSLSQAWFSTAEVEDNSEDLLRQLSYAIKKPFNQIKRRAISCNTLHWFFMA